jgi:hypothetical protein
VDGKTKLKKQEAAERTEKEIADANCRREASSKREQDILFFLF